MSAASEQLCVSPSASQRLAFAAAFLRALPPSSPALLLVPSHTAGTRLIAEVLSTGQARFGWRKRSLDAVARELALPELAREGRVPLRSLGNEALVTRVVHELHGEGALGRYAALRDRPGFVRVLAKTLSELRLAEVAPDALVAHAPELARVFAAYEQALTRLALADRAHLLEAAVRALAAGTARGAPLLALDVPLESRREGLLARALCQASGGVCVTVPRGDEHAEVRWRLALGPTARVVRQEPGETTDLTRLQLRLFARRGRDEVKREAVTRGAVTIVSSPGEARESVELARGVLAMAAQGVPFDRMAIALRAVEGYRGVLEEALGRAGIPAHFADGVRRPRVEGRALLALLGCAREGLSARNFAEYLSLGVVPALPVGQATEPAVSPRKWERMLVDAAVIGGRTRWAARLSGLAASLAAEGELLEPDDPRRAESARERSLLASLEGFALPVLDLLEALPEGGTWGQWMGALSRLATQALREPDAVLELLDELAPLAPVGPVSLHVVYRVLSARLSSVVLRDSGHGAGKLFVGAIDDLRGRVFDVVLVPGLAERLFPPRLSEDALLPDAARRQLSPELWVTDERVARERLQLRLAVGAAESRLWLSFPRFDVVHARPRVPSFYGLEVLQAIDGTLPAFDELTRRAQPGAAARMGFPAPEQPSDAIDDAEYDLAMLARLLRDAPEGDRKQRRGAARYLLEVSSHLARALRFRARRWEVARLSSVDGFVATDEATRGLLAPERLARRAYSATALAQLAPCPYRFYLHAVLGLAPQREALAADELDARQRGVLFHRIQRALLERLRADDLLPLCASALPQARALLGEVFDAHAASARDEFAPSIERVFTACLSGLRTDLDAWLTRLVGDEAFVPAYFELGFGVGGDRERDASSRPEPVTLAIGVQLRGAIDLVERALPVGEPAVLRATDHKTSAAPARLGIVGGGRSLQPLLYALALEQLFPEARVSGGRLYFCTTRGGFESHEVRLDATARSVAQELVTSIDALIAEGLLPAAPALLPEDRTRVECERCAYQVVCGPHERERFYQVKHADHRRLAPLFRVRNLP